MPRQWLFIGALALGLFSFAWWGLPPVEPAPPVETVLPVTSHHEVRPSTPPNPSAITYGLFMPRLTRYAQDIPLSIWAPTQGWPGTVLEECYRQGSLVTLYYNVGLLLESPKPMATDEAPSASTPVMLANGTPALWQWFPGEAGSPNRLTFREGGTYVQLILFGTRATSLAAAEYLANQCHPVVGG